MALLFTKMRLLGFKSKGALSHETVSFTTKMQDENRAGAKTKQNTWSTKVDFKL